MKGIQPDYPTAHNLEGAKESVLVPFLFGIAIDLAAMINCFAVGFK